MANFHLKDQVRFNAFLEEIQCILNKNPVTCIKDERVAPDLLGSITRVFLCIIPKNPMLRCFLPEVSLALLKRVTIILIIRPSLLLGFPGWWEEETAAYQSSTE